MTNFTSLNQDDKVRALANYLQVRYSEAKELIDNEQWVVYTEDEAYGVASEYIMDSLWTFNRSFIARFSSIAESLPDKAWTQLVSTLCEDFNDTIRAMIEAESDFDTFIETAIEEDGLGYFLNTYDGECQETYAVCSCNLDGDYIIARIN